MTSIAADLAAPADVRLRVVSAAGRVVREIYAGRLGAGRVAFPWDGRDESGARVSAGVYFLNLTAGDQSAVERIAVIP
jgi:flagellar hook assembly protein FlgD